MSRPSRTPRPRRSAAPWPCIPAAATLALLLTLSPAAAGALPLQDGPGAEAGAREGAEVALPTTAAAQDRPAVETRLYTVRYGNAVSAERMAQQLCNEARFNSQPQEVYCTVEPITADRIAVTGPPTLLERVEAGLAEIDVPPLTQTFHIVVLRAGPTGSIPGDLPEDARAALADLTELMPYEGFVVTDTGWLRTAENAETALSGPSGFEVFLRFRGQPGEGNTLMIESFHLAQNPVQGMSLEEMARWNESLGQLPGSRSILESSFGMDVGETVVVGTSRLNGGDEALVVLLTARR